METKSGALRTRESTAPRHILKKHAVKTATSRPLSPAPRIDRVTRYIEESKPETPFLIVDLSVVEQNYRALRKSLPMADVFYAVKANPAPEVIRTLARLGSSFDVASVAEIQLVLDAGVEPSRISFGNTIKKQRDIALAHERGVRLYAFDSEAELQKISRVAPGSDVFCRLLMSCDGADWPLSRKFGCEIGMAHDLLLKARTLGLNPCGVSFHVGSQQTRLDQWGFALERTAALFSALKTSGIDLNLVNIGGGLPARYTSPVEPVESYSAAIATALEKHFGSDLPRIITEPGRSLVGDAGILEAEVVLISKKSDTEDVRWVYLDIGKFGGLAETHDEAIKYRIETLGRKGATGPVILAGPSCDSVDILYEKYKYELPLSLKIGDRVRLHATGAYTSSYASVGFNGFAPLSTHCIE